MYCACHPLAEQKYEGNLNNTLEALQKTTEAYPRATPQEMENHIIFHLIRILAGVVANHFARHDPKGLDQVLVTIRRLFTPSSLPPSMPQTCHVIQTSLDAPHQRAATHHHQQRKINNTGNTTQTTRRSTIIDAYSIQQS